MHEQWKAQSERREADEKIRRANAEGFRTQAEDYYDKIQSEGVLVTPPCSDCSRMGKSCKMLPWSARFVESATRVPSAKDARPVT